jgi:hypothetical protein
LGIATSFGTYGSESQANRTGARIELIYLEYTSCRFAPFMNLDATFYSLQKGEQAGSDFKELLSNG